MSHPIPTHDPTVDAVYPEDEFVAKTLTQWSPLTQEQLDILRNMEASILFAIDSFDKGRGHDVIADLVFIQSKINELRNSS